MVRYIFWLLNHLLLDSRIYWPSFNAILAHGDGKRALFFHFTYLVETIWKLSIGLRHFWNPDRLLFLEWPGCFLELSEEQKCKRPLENFHMVPTLLTCLPNANHISGFHRAVLNTYISLLASTLCSKQSKCSKKILNSKIWPISHYPLLLSALIISSIFGGQRKMDMVDVQNAWVSNLFLQCTVM